MDEQLFEVFATFCSFGDRSGTCEMDGARFAKLCKDTKIINSRFSRTDVDLTFAKVKDKSARRINFEQFQDALMMAGAQIWRNSSPDEAFQKARERVLTNGAPKLSNTTATFADEITEKMTDVNLYSGAHKERFNEDGTGRGREGRDYLPKGVGTSTSGAGSGAVHDLSEITRSNLNAPGPARVSPRERVSPRVSPRAPPAPQPQRSPRREEPVYAQEEEEGQRGRGGDPLQSRFMEFCSFGDRANTGQMDNAKFSKFARDMGLISKNCTKTDVDLIFTRVKAKGERKLQYMQFLNGLMEIGVKKFPQLSPDEAFDQVCIKILGESGPQSSGTQAEKGGVVDKLTDVSSYTSTHKQRFDAEGKGRGIAGRDLGAVGSGHVPGGLTYQGGNVRDLSQITRSGF